MINTVLLYLIHLAIYVFAGLIIYLPVKAAKKDLKSKKGLIDTAAFCYIIALLALTVFPFAKITGGNIFILSFFFRSGNFFRFSKLGVNSYFSVPVSHILQLVPFASVSSYLSRFADLASRSIEDWIRLGANICGNIVLFLPLGFFAKIKKKSPGFLIIVSLVLILAIEAIQYIEGRSADIDDVILSLAGAVIGYFATAAVVKKKK